MVDDIQTGMLPSNQTTTIAHAATTQIQKRAPGGTMNSQHDFDKARNGNTGGKYVLY